LARGEVAESWLIGILCWVLAGVDVALLTLVLDEEEIWVAPVVLVERVPTICVGVAQAGALVLHGRAKG